MSCGGNCACARAASETKEEICAMPKDGLKLDNKGLCPCGKTEDDCCSPESFVEAGHKDKFPKGENEAVYELCKKHGKRHLCE